MRIVEWSVEELLAVFSQSFIFSSVVKMDCFDKKHLRTEDSTRLPSPVSLRLSKKLCVFPPGSAEEANPLKLVIAMNTFFARIYVTMIAPIVDTFIDRWATRSRKVKFWAPSMESRLGKEQKPFFGHFLLFFLFQKINSQSFLFCMIPQSRKYFCSKSQPTEVLNSDIFLRREGE